MRSASAVAADREAGEMRREEAAMTGREGLASVRASRTHVKRLAKLAVIFLLLSSCSAAAGAAASHFEAVKVHGPLLL